jgi:two-component system, OmpR family, response regulator
VGKVVFVEDDAAIRKLVQAAMRATPHEIHIAVNGREGLELVERVRPDVVFTDVSMPEMDGLELCDAIRARPHLAATPIVFMTASVQREQVDRYLARGAVAFIAKPFSTSELRAQVAKLVPS